MAIKSFRDGSTAAIFDGARVRSLPPGIQQAARRKLDMLHAATRLEHLMIPPANRLESMRGARAGQHRVRINDQWRICFRWTAPDAYDVEICDYHR